MVPIPKFKTLFWTQHSREKMRYWKLSQARVKRVIHSPKRIEEGVAPKTVALMQPASTNRAHEIWVMLQETPRRRRVISAWRYPGKTKPGEPLPEEILKELRAAL